MFIGKINNIGIIHGIYIPKNVDVFLWIYVKDCEAWMVIKKKSTNLFTCVPYVATYTPHTLK